MKLNDNVKFVLFGIYLYDIEACHYTIMEKMGLDLSGIDRNNKKERNIQIGQIMRKNPKLTSLLRTTTESIIDEYIAKNNITENDIIIRQYDGIITTKKLQYTNIGHIPLDLRKFFDVFIISINRKSYIALDTNKDVTIKGIPFRYEKIDKIYENICNINFANKHAIFLSLQKIKDSILNSTEPELFAIPTKDDKFTIFLKGYNEVEVTKPTLKIIDTSDIDKQRYFQFYIQPFTKSITFDFVR